MSEESPSDYGWFAFAPKGTSDDDFVNPPVQDVYLHADEYGGPFWSSEGGLGADYDDVHADLGISRSLYDDVMAWNDAALASGADQNETFTRQQDLLRRLGDEVKPGIKVPAPRSSPRVVMKLLEDNVDASALPEPLASELIAWRRDAATYAYATGENDAEIWAWQDLGSALAARVNAVLGDDYVVQPF